MLSIFAASVRLHWLVGTDDDETVLGAEPAQDEATILSDAPEIIESAVASVPREWDDGLLRQSPSSCLRRAAMAVSRDLAAAFEVADEDRRKTLLKEIRLLALLPPPLLEFLAHDMSLCVRWWREMPMDGATMISSRYTVYECNLAVMGGQ